MKALIATMTLLWAAGASAAGPSPQIHTGTHTNRETAQTHYGLPDAFPERIEVQPTDEALFVGRAMARCAVSEHRRDVKFALDVSSVEAFRQATQKFSGSLADCLAYSGKDVAAFSQFQLAPHALAGLLAEALLRQEGIPALLPGTYQANAPQLDWMAASGGSLAELRLGECLAQTQPSAVAALIGSAPSSPQEQAAFQGLMPFVPACLDKNVTLKATRSSLRLALAFALYRRTIRTEPARVSAQ